MARSFAVLFALPTTLLLMTVAAPGHDRTEAFRSRSWNDQALTMTFEAKITDVMLLPGSSPENAKVEIRTLHDSKPLLIRIGPAGYLKRLGLSLKEGDVISVTGYLVSASPDDVLVATEITRQGKTLHLRDKRGRSLW